MAQPFNPILLTEEIYQISQTENAPSRVKSSRTYYDLTPPVEVDNADDLYISQPAPIDEKAEPLVAVIGVGYVGEHLVHLFSKKHAVIGYDVSESRTKQLAEKFSETDRVRFTTKPQELSNATHFLISVPTLLLPDKTIDSSSLWNALVVVEQFARKGAVVVIESSVAVGMTRELLGPLAKAKGFFAGMSPERVDPGRTEPPPQAIPKVISGLDDIVPGSLSAIMRLYQTAFDTIVTVSQPEVAEMMKLYENCQRMICIAYANEMADACLSHGIDPYEVCRAASTKPFGYMPFTPGLGVGGHCIPVNPYYLLSNNKFPLLQAAAERTRVRPAVIADRIVNRVCEASPSGLCPQRPRVLVVGVGFKIGQCHLANSPGLELAKQLVLTEKVTVTWVDPLVAAESIPQIPRLGLSDWNPATLEAKFDIIIVSLRQQGLDFGILERLQGVEIEMWCP